MTVFLDASAAVKLYADEERSAHVRSLADPLVVAEVSRVEVPAALHRKRRMRELDSETTDILIRQFEIDYHGTTDRPPRFVQVAVHDVLERAAGLVGTHALRAYDAVQLAAALTVVELDASLTFCAFDRGLARAARDEGLAIAVP